MVDFKELIKRDVPYIIAIILCLGAVAYDLMHQQAILNKCNEQWQEQVIVIEQNPGLYPNIQLPDHPINVTWDDIT